MFKKTAQLAHVGFPNLYLKSGGAKAVTRQNGTPRKPLRWKPEKQPKPIQTMNWSVVHGDDDSGHEVEDKFSLLCVPKMLFLVVVWIYVSHKEKEETYLLYHTYA